MMSMQQFTIHVVGAKHSGKTSLIHTLVHKRFPSADAETSYRENFAATSAVITQGNQQHVTFVFAEVDHPHPEEFKYNDDNCDLVIICMDIADISALQKVPNRTNNELDIASKKRVLIATKSDTRGPVQGDESSVGDTSLISMQQFQSMCDIFQIALFIELSTKYMNAADIDELLQRLGEAAFETGIRRRTAYGHKLPKDPLIWQADTEWDQMVNNPTNEDYVQQTQLLIAGYLNAERAQTRVQIPIDMHSIVYMFYREHNVYYLRRHAMDFVSNFAFHPQLQKNFHVMFWMDLAAIAVHNLVWIYFALELLARGDKTLGIAAVLLAVLESVLICVGYMLLWKSARFEYYTQALSAIHLPMECVVNLPMILIVFLYAFGTTDALIPSFYVSIVFYILYAAYKYFVMDLWWGDKNRLFDERWFGICVPITTIIWMIAMLSLLVIGIFYSVQATRLELSVTLIVMSFVLFALVGMCAYIECVLNVQNTLDYGGRRRGLRLR